MNLGTLQEEPGRMMRSLVAECIGTLILLLAALFAPPNLVFIGVGLTLLVLVATIGKISGSHVNPAVTLSLMLSRQIKVVDGLFYMLAQTLGAILAVFIARGLGHTVALLQPEPSAFWFELLGAFILTFVVAQVVVKNVAEAGTALAIGGALAVGIMIAGGASGGVLNPALALGLMSGQVIQNSYLAYLIAPFIGGALGGLLATFLGKGKTPAEPSGAQEGNHDRVIMVK